MAAKSRSTRTRRNRRGQLRRAIARLRKRPVVPITLNQFTSGPATVEALNEDGAARVLQRLLHAFPDNVEAIEIKFRNKGVNSDE